LKSRAVELANWQTANWQTGTFDIGPNSRHQEWFMLRSTKLTILSIVVGHLILAGSVSAADDGLFDRLDKNSDGIVDKSELGEADERIVKRLLRTSDKDGDGELTRDELSDGTTTRVEPKGRLEAQPQARPGQRMALSPQEIIKRVDRDGDGAVSRSEAPERMKQNFDRIDADGDGKVTASEFARAISALGRQNPPANTPETSPAPEKKDPATDQANANARQLIDLFRARDTDENGRISVDEVPQQRRQEFLNQLKKMERSPEEGISFREFMEIGKRKLSNRTGGNQPGSNRKSDRPQPVKPVESTPGPARYAQEVARKIKQIDADGNGTISKDEAPQRLRQAFNTVDADGNGELDAKELERVYARRQR
jgi:Ca2+-binding EF-hand superfamily protein